MIGFLHFLFHRSRMNNGLAMQILSQLTSPDPVLWWNAFSEILHCWWQLGTMAYSKISTVVHGIFSSFSETQILQETNWKANTVRVGLGNVLDLLSSGTRESQNCISLSTLEDEYVALCDTTCELQWIRTHQAELQFSMNKPSQLLCDNTAANLQLTA